MNVAYIQDDSDEDETSRKIRIKRGNCNFGLLQAWYEDLYLSVEACNSPSKKQKTKTEGKVLVVIIPDFESFNEKVLQDFILIVR